MKTKTIWNTQKILERLKKNFPKYKFKITEPGGDFDTETIWVREKGTETGVCGFHSMNPIPRDITEPTIEFIMIASDMKEGMDNSTPNEMILIGKVAKVIKRMGYEISTAGTAAHF